MFASPCCYEMKWALIGELPVATVGIGLSPARPRELAQQRGSPSSVEFALWHMVLYTCRNGNMPVHLWGKLLLAQVTGKQEPHYSSMQSQSMLNVILLNRFNPDMALLMVYVFFSFLF